MKKQQKYFKIGEVSKLYHIGVDSIRYYEEVGVIEPKRDPVNNYRLYSLDDMRKITMIRELLALNFSMEEIKYFEENRTLDTTQSLLKKELHIINHQIQELEEQKQSIKNRLSSVESSIKKTDFTSIRELTLPERACIMVSDTNIPDDYVDYSLIKFVHLHPQKVDTIGTCNCYTLDLPGSNPDSKYYRTKNVFFYSDHPTYESNYTLPEGLYLSLIFTGSPEITKIKTPELFAYAKEHNLRVIGDPIEFCPIDNYETSDIHEYITELQLPVARDLF